MSRQHARPMTHARRFAVGVVVSLFCVAFSLAESPTVEGLFPASAQPGTTVTVEVVGNVTEWPLQAWIDRKGIEVIATEEQGKISVRVDSDATCGIYWIRLFNADGAAKPRPFFVEPLAHGNEIEPNDALEDVQRIDLPRVINGRLQKRGDVDSFAIGLSQGEQLVVAQDANRGLGSPMDGVIQVCDKDGFVLDQNDDARGIDPGLVFTAPRDETYVVRTFAFPATPNSSIGFAGDATYVYRLTITTGGFVDHVRPLAVMGGMSHDVRLFGWNIPESEKSLSIVGKVGSDNVTFCHPRLASSIRLLVTDHPSLVAMETSAPKTPQRMEIPSTITGVIESQEDVDAFEFSAAKGQMVRFHVASDSLGYLLDPVLKVIDGNDKTLAEVDDANRRRDADLTMTIPDTGPYRLLIHDAFDHGGFRYVYRITAREVRPDYSLELGKDSFTAQKGQPLEISVNVERHDGFSEEIEVTAIDLPDGITVEKAKSLAEGDSAKVVKLSVKSELDSLSAPFQIIGRAGQHDSIERLARYTINEQHHATRAWLTVVASQSDD